MAKPYIPYNGPLVTRQEALANGLTRYFTGKPCKRGHVSERLAARWQCAECNRIKKYAPTSRMIATKKKWLLENKDRINFQLREWRKANPDKWRKIIKRSEAKRRSSEGQWQDSDIDIIFIEQGGKCSGCLCDISGYFEVDHVKPLALGGSNWPSNLQLLCLVCNRKKGAKNPLDWFSVICKSMLERCKNAQASN